MYMFDNTQYMQYYSLELPHKLPPRPVRLPKNSRVFFQVVFFPRYGNGGGAATTVPSCPSFRSWIESSHEIPRQGADGLQRDAIFPGAGGWGQVGALVGRPRRI